MHTSIQRNSKMKPVKLNNAFSAPSGYTILQNSVYQIGKFVFGNIVVKKNSGNFSASQETVLTTLIPITDAINTGCFLSNDQWSNKTIGYLFLNKTGVTVSTYESNLECNVAKIFFEVALSE